MKKFLFAALLPFFYLISSFTPFLSAPEIAASASVAFSDALAVSAEITVSAELGGYAYVPTEHVYLYSDVADESARRGLFRLPCTYYVRLLSSVGEYYRVEYLSDGKSTKQVRGYCKKSEVIPVDYTPAVPYLYKTVEVVYELPDGGDKGGTLSVLKVICAYYGDYSDGTETYCYVLRDEAFGYIPKPTDFSYERNTEYESRHQEEIPPADGQSDESTGMSPAQIVLLVLLCLLIPAIAALILRPSKRQPYESEEYY